MPALVCLLFASLAYADPQRPNVLLICVDDLRPELHCYGHPIMKTPHMDRLAGEGRMFARHYAAVPTCGASRYALMTGLRPSRTRALDNGAFGRMRGKDEDKNAPESLAHRFRLSGYRTVSIGKVSHSPDGYVYGYNRPPSDVLEMPHSWDQVRLPLGKWKHGWDSFFAYADGTGRNDRRARKQDVPAMECADVPDTGYPDGLIAEDAVGQLRDLKQRGRPFLLAVGFFKPHLPFNAPKKYWDLYPPDLVKLSPTDDLRSQTGGEFWGYTHPAGAKADADYHRRIRRAYFAAVSYVDAQVGKVLDAVDELGLRDQTVVVLWGDHGWHLGDLNHWGKHTSYEWALRSAFIMRTPNMNQPGKATSAIVETLDIYPTLVDLCRLGGADGLDGVSLRPVLDDPEHPGKTGAIGYWGNARSLRTARYRLIAGKDLSAKGAKLFDHQADPDEARDLAEQQPQLVAELLRQLRADSPTLVTAE